MGFIKTMQAIQATQASRPFHQQHQPQRAHLRDLPCVQPYLDQAPFNHQHPGVLPAYQLDAARYQPQVAPVNYHYNHQPQNQLVPLDYQQPRAIPVTHVEYARYQPQRAPVYYQPQASSFADCNFSSGPVQNSCVNGQQPQQPLRGLPQRAFSQTVVANPQVQQRKRKAGESDGGFSESHDDEFAEISREQWNRASSKRRKTADRTVRISLEHYQPVVPKALIEQSSQLPQCVEVAQEAQPIEFLTSPEAYVAFVKALRAFCDGENEEEVCPYLG